MKTEVGVRGFFIFFFFFPTLRGNKEHHDGRRGWGKRRIGGPRPPPSWGGRRPPPSWGGRRISGQARRKGKYPDVVEVARHAFSILVSISTEISYHARH
jgi:hypothetical protein